MPPKVTNIETYRIIDTFVHVPPQLEAVAGYEGESRYVALYWTPCGDSIVFDDGLCSGTGFSWGWLAFARHRIVQPLLWKIQYGASDADPEVWLLLDREARKLLYGQPAAVQAAIRKQHPEMRQAKPLIMTAEDFAAVANELEARIAEQATREAILRRMQEGRQRQDEMIVCLDDMCQHLEQN